MFQVIFWIRHSQNLPRTHSGESHLLVKKVPNNFLRRSHSPVPCLLFQKRKSLVSFKDSKNSNIFMFWLLRTSLTTILHRIFEIRKESCWVVSLIFKLFFSDNCYDKVKDSPPCQHYFQWLLFIDIIKDILDKIEKLLIK